MDLTQDVIYRGFTLNDSAIQANTVGGNGVGAGIAGCILDSADYRDVDVVQNIEKKAQQDGMDVGDVFKGARRVRLSGTLYGTSRADLYDRWRALRAALDPVLAQSDEPADKGYQPLYFSEPTLRLSEFSSGYIDQRILCMPRSDGGVIQRDMLGGNDDDSLAIMWNAVLIARDPRVYGQTEQDYDLGTVTAVTGVTATASTDLINKTAHGLVADDRVTFSAMTGGTGLTIGTTYFVLASGLTANAFKVSLTSGGSAINITVDGTAMTYVKSVTVSGNLVNRGNYYSPINMLIVVGTQAGVITVQAGTSVFTITVPSSTNSRTIRLKGDDRILTTEELSVEITTEAEITFSGDNTWPLMQPGTHSWSITFAGVTVQSGSHMWAWESYA